MTMVANNPTAAKRVGVPKEVGEEFEKADKGKKFNPAKQKATAEALKKKKPVDDMDSDGY